MKSRGTKIINTEAVEPTEKQDDRLIISKMHGLIGDRGIAIDSDVYVDEPATELSDVVVARIAQNLSEGCALVIPVEYAEPYARWAALYLAKDTERSDGELVVFVR